MAFFISILDNIPLADIAVPISEAGDDYAEALKRAKFAEDNLLREIEAAARDASQGL